MKTSMTFAAVAMAAGFSAARASDVYTTFYNSAGNTISGTNFDVGNGGCFSLPDAQSVSVNQNANGPYCLSAYQQGGCQVPGNAQTFSGLKADGTHYALNAVAGAASFRWATHAC